MKKRAWVINESNGYKGLSLEEFEEEIPGPGKVRLQIEAFALNWGDMDLMHDHYSFSFPQFPARIGMEAAGIVDMVAPGVTGIEVGERYSTLPYFYYNEGTSAESAVVDARYVTKAPKGLSAVESASVWMQYLTAYYPLVAISNIGPKSNILIPAATSTAGTAAVQIGRMHGANVIGTTRFDYNEQYLKEMGADYVFVAGSGGLAEAIETFTDGRGVDVIFDPTGAVMIDQYKSSLAKNARMFFYGFLDGKLPDVPIMELLVANASFHPYSLFNYVEDSDMLNKGKSFLYDALESGALTPTIDKVFPMEGYVEAWDYLSAPRKSHGKVVIEV